MYLPICFYDFVWLKFRVLLPYFAEGFSSFRQAFPEWCEDDSQAHNKEMESSRNAQADQLMGLRLVFLAPSSEKKPNFNGVSKLIFIYFPFSTDHFAFPRHIPIRHAAAQPNLRTAKAPRIITTTTISTRRLSR